MITPEQILKTLDVDGIGLSMIDELSSIGTSLDLVFAVNQLEVEYGLDIPNVDLVNFNTVGDLVEYAIKRMKV